MCLITFLSASERAKQHYSLCCHKLGFLKIIISKYINYIVMVRPVDGFKEINYNGKFVYFQKCFVLNDARSCSVVQSFSFLQLKQ